MKTYYYKILDNKGNVIGVTDSSALRYYSTYSKIMLCCNESLAQYIYYDGIFYRVEWFNKEALELKGEYPIAQAHIISKEEFEQLNSI